MEKIAIESIDYRINELNLTTRVWLISYLQQAIDGITHVLELLKENSIDDILAEPFVEMVGFTKNEMLKIQSKQQKRLKDEIDMPSNRLSIKPDVTFSTVS